MARVRQRKQRYELVSPKGVKVTVADDENVIKKYVAKGYTDPTGKHRVRSARGAKAAPVAKSA